MEYKVYIPKSRLNNDIQNKLLSFYGCTTLQTGSKQVHEHEVLRKFLVITLANKKAQREFAYDNNDALKCFAIFELNPNEDYLLERPIHSGKKLITVLEIKVFGIKSVFLLGYALRNVGNVVYVSMSSAKDKAYVEFAHSGTLQERKKSFKQLEEIRQLKKKERQENFSSISRSGWRTGVAKRLSNGDKSTSFRQWLVDKYSCEYLNRGAGILDVAGGNGELAFKLENYSRIRTTIVDPRPYNLLRMLKHLTKDHLSRLRKRKTGDLVKHLESDIVVQLPLPKHIRCWFTSDSISESELADSLKEYAKEELSSCVSERQRLEELKGTCSLVIGMHPDQATEAIVDIATELNKPFAIVPCCVYPKLFPQRGDVKTYDEFCDYLIKKSKARYSRLQKNYSWKVDTEILPFSGRNRVIYSYPDQ